MNAASATPWPTGNHNEQRRRVGIDMAAQSENSGGIVYMTKLHNPLVIVCPVCDTEYVGDPSTPCPLCPLGQTAVATAKECSKVQRYWVIGSRPDRPFETELNDAAAEGWHIDQFLVGQTLDERRPVLIALMIQPAYDRGAHIQALEAKRDANMAFERERARVAAEVEAFKSQVTANSLAS